MVVDCLEVQKHKKPVRITGSGNASNTRHGDNSTIILLHITRCLSCIENYATFRKLDPLPSSGIKRRKNLIQLCPWDISPNPDIGGQQSMNLFPSYTWWRKHIKLPKRRTILNSTMTIDNAQQNNVTINKWPLSINYHRIIRWQSHTCGPQDRMCSEQRAGRGRAGQGSNGFRRCGCRCGSVGQWAVTCRLHNQNSWCGVVSAFGTWQAH